MDAEAFAAELGDRFVYCPHCHRTHLWTKATAWLEAARDAHPDDESPHPRVKSILIAEDHELVAELFADLFALNGWIAATYHEGRGAADALSSSTPYDAMLVSNRLHGMSGVELITRARVLDHRKEMPIVMVTGTGDVAVVAAALAAGADDILYKPTDVDILVATVTKCVERRRPHNA
jgi:two-component system C4-dicarboxylate transport response regulator DctD